MSYIKNRADLLSAGDVKLRGLLLDIAEEGLASADPRAAVGRHLSREGDRLAVGDQVFDLSKGQRLFVVGAGKASYLVGRALDDLLGDRIFKGLITCKHGQVGHLDHIELHHAGHPLPDAASLEASLRTVRLLDEVRPGDIVLAAFTGGSSSLFVSPVEGISLEDKAETSMVLLNSGANILEINAVRKHLSTVKGGRLIRSLPAGAHVINLTVSDVIGDPLDYITDPSVADTSTFADAKATLDKYDLWSRLPASVTTHIREAATSGETVRPDGLAHLHRTDIVLVGADAACFGAVEAARRRGLTPLLLSTLFEGESSALGRFVGQIARQIVLNDNPVPPPCVLIAGGETTVSVHGASGRGGPNQEFAAGAALDLEGTQGIVVLSIDTDGTDGPTEYAGALIDGGTSATARSAGVDLYAALAAHDVTPALERTGNLVVTGATGTNVNDLRLVLVDPGARSADR